MPPPGDLHDPGTKPTSLALAGRFFTTEPPGKPISVSTCLLSVSHLQLSLSHLLTICQSRYVSSTCLLSSYHLCVNKSIYLSLVISARLSFIHQHICYLFISPSITFLSIIYLSILEKEMAAHSSTLAWKIPWTEEPHKLQSMGSQRVSHD